ncbi:flavodoxin domain-containing protein [Thermodesulfobacteriota bacterium]
MHTQIIYYSKYGATAEIARKLGDRLETDSIADINAAPSIEAELVVVGSAIYSERPSREILELLADTPGLLQDRQVALFVVCLATVLRTVGQNRIGGPVYLEKMKSVLGCAPLAEQVFGGRLILDRLEPAERQRQEAFYKKRGREYTDLDMMKEAEIDAFVDRIQAGIG